MARLKYYYNPQTLKFEHAKVKKGSVVLMTMLFVGSVILLSVGLVAAAYRFGFFQTKTATRLRVENEQLRSKYEFIQGEIEVLESNIEKLATKDDQIYRAIFDEFVDTLGTKVRLKNLGQVVNYNELIASGKADDLIETKLKKIDELDKRVSLQLKSYKELEKAARQYDLMLSSKPAIQPIKNSGLTKLASGFGWRIHPILKVKKFHEGIDFTAHKGTAIYATGDGRVRKVATNMGGYGKEIEIDHGFGYVTKYAHLQSFKVRQGQQIKRGEIIGQVGNTGASTAPHLHYEVIYKGSKINPVYYFYQDLNAEQFEEILRLASIENKSLS
jgi:murein DD-endopeptidase MepM/ murein hydrolase activator NlpD